MSKYLLFNALIVIFLGCHDTVPINEIELVSTEILCENCQSPNLHLQGNGELLISYIKAKSDSLDQLLLHNYANGKTSPSSLIIEGQNWFVNWADIPGVVSMDQIGSKIMAHWLQMSAGGTYDYDVACAITDDDIRSSESPFVLHDDGIPAEHGFVTMISDESGVFVTWLDGRNTKTPLPDLESNKNIEHEHGGHTHDHGATMPMTLRAAWIDKAGNKTNDLEIDNRVCDCCQTDAVMTNSGPIVVYRDRTEDEVRDISIAKYRNGVWVNQKVQNDNWEIAGCPVNGPAAAYKNGLLAVAWYTEMNGIPKIQVATSSDDGDTFNESILIDGEGALGRVDVVVSEDGDIIITWVNMDGEKAYIKASIIKDGDTVVDGVSLMETSPSRSSGFPIVELVEQHLIMVRTLVEEDDLSVELSKMRIR